MMQLFLMKLSEWLVGSAKKKRVVKFKKVIKGYQNQLLSI